MKIYGMNDVITVGRIKSKTPEEILKKDKHRIFKLIKEGLRFNDEVLQAAGIKRIVRDERIENSVCEHKSDNKRLPKDKMPLERILEILSTAENSKTQTDE